jgi:hypothetical protein
MTISSSYVPASYAGTGVTTAFATGFPFQSITQLVVTVLNNATGAITTLTPGVDYTVTGAGYPAATGTVNTTVPVASGSTITIARLIALSQATTWQFNDAYPANYYRVENALDLMTMAIQGLSFTSGRVLTLRPQDTDGSGWYDAHGNGIRNLAAGVLGNDATTVSQVNTFVANIIATGGQMVPQDFNYTGDGTTTAFAITGATIATPSSYTVVVGGLVQRATNDYTINLSTNPPVCNFVIAPPSGATIYIKETGFLLPMNVVPGIDAGLITTGTVNPARLGGGSATAGTFLNGLSQWTNALIGPLGTASPPTDTQSLFTVQQTGAVGMRVYAGAGAQASYRFGTVDSGNPWDSQWLYDPGLAAMGWQHYGGPTLGLFYNNGDVVFGNSGLFYQRATNRVGINTSNPQYTLDVGGTVNATRFLGQADGSLITSGQVLPQFLGGGPASNITVLFGDGVWRVPPGGSGSTSTTTTGTFVVAAAGSSQTVPVTSATGFSVNNYIYVSDGTHTLSGQITAIAGLNFTVVTTVINAGSAGNTMASGAVVAQSIPASSTFATINLPATTGAANGVIYFGGVPYLYGAQASAFSIDTYIGGAGNFTTGAMNNIGIGLGALKLATSTGGGGANFAAGLNALANTTSPSSVVAVGSSAMASGTGALFGTVALGALAGSGIGTGQKNTFVGYNAGGAAGSYAALNKLLFLGYNVSHDTASSDGALSIQNIIFGINNTGESNVISTGNIGIGIKLPAYKLDVAGNINSSAGYIGVSYAENTNALGTVGTTPTANFTTAAFNTATIPSSQTSTFTFTAPPFANTLCYLRITVGGAGAVAVFPGTVLGAAPALPASGSMLFTFKWDGTNYYLLSAVAAGTSGGLPPGGTAASFLRGDNAFSSVLQGQIGAIYGSSGTAPYAVLIPSNDGTNQYTSMAQGNLPGTAFHNRYWDFDGQLIIGSNITPATAGSIIDSAVTTETLYSAGALRTGQWMRSLAGYWNYIQTISGPGATVTLEVLNGAYKVITGFTTNTTLNISDSTALPSVGTYRYSGEMTVEIVSPGANTVTFGAVSGTITWLTGSQPAPAASGITVYRFTKRQGTAGWLGRAEPQAGAAYTNANAQDAVGGIFAATATITPVYTSHTSMAWNINNTSVTAAMLAGNIPFSLLSGYPSDATKFARGDGTWAVPGGGGGSSIQFQSNGTNVGAAGAFTTYNFQTGISLSAAGSVMNVFPDRTFLQSYLNWQLNGATLNVPGTPITAINFTTGMGVTVAGNTITVTSTGGGGSFSPATAYNWTAPQTLNSAFTGGASTSSAVVLVNPTYPASSPFAAGGLIVNVTDNSSTGDVMSYTSSKVSNVNGSAVSQRHGLSLRGNTSTGFSINHQIITQVSKVAGGFGDSVWIDSNGPSVSYSSTPDANGVTHAFSNGWVRGGEVNYGNAWQDFGFTDDRTGVTRAVVGLEFFPDWLPYDTGAGSNTKFNVQWAIAIGNSGPGNSNGTAKNWIGILGCQDGIVPGGIWANLHGGSSSGNATGVGVNFQNYYKTGINFAGLAGGAPASGQGGNGNAATIVPDASGQQPAITLAQGQAICFAPSTGAGTGVYIVWDGTHLKATINGGTSYTNII